MDKSTMVDIAIAINGYSINREGIIRYNYMI